MSMSAAALWGIAGVIALLANAIYRLAPYALELVQRSLTAVELAALVVWVAFNAYSEGYRAFHRMFSPRVVARARTLAGAKPLFVALAPLYCMGLFHATRRRLLISWSITVGVVGIVILVRSMAQPWRGIIDAGVVVGLTWGLVSLLVFAAHAFGPRGLDHPAEVAN